MALRKILFQNSTEGFYEEAADGDTYNVGGLTVAAAGNIVLSGGGEVTGLPSTPSGSTAATSKAYVDAVAQGLDLKGSCKAVSLSNIASLSGLAATVDGVALDTDGMRVLLAGQTDPIENGIWVVHSGAWTRATDMAAGSSAAGAFTFIEEGTLYADTGWVCTTNSPSDVVGTNSLAFTQFSGAGTYVGGDGIDITGTTIKVDLATDPGLEFDGGSPNKLRVKVNPAGAIERVAAGLGVKLEASNPSLQIASNELGVKLDPARAITKNASGIGVNLETSNPALEIVTNLLDVKYQTAKALASDASGLYVKVDGTTVGYNGSGELESLGSAEAERVENSLNGTGGTVAAGDPVYYTGTNDIIDEADTTDAKAKVIGVCRDATTITALQIVSSGPCAGVLSSATAGTPYYLADGGGLSTSLPAAGKRVIQCGIAMNATDLFVRIVDYGKKAA